MSRKEVFVIVSPSRLEVAVLRGQTVESRIERPDAPDWADNWPGVLGTLDGALARLVSEFGVNGAPARIVYAAPSAVSGVFSCPSTAGRAAAERAATLGLAGLCTFSCDDNPSVVAHLLTDRAGSKDAKAGGPGSQRHSIGVADQDASAAAVAAWGQRAGLIVQSIVPLEAACILDAAAEATRPTEGAEVRAVLWLGETMSVLATGAGGGLRFVRVLGVGTEALVEALLRPMRVRPSGSAPGAVREPVTLDRAAARKLLETHGIPTPDRVIDEQRGIDGSSVLPLLQPVLQRISVEVKQSLRFGLDDAERPQVRLLATGPGAAITNLRDILARQCGFPLDRATIAENGLFTSLSNSPQVALRPRVLENTVTLRRVRQGVWAGIAATLAMLGLDAVSARSALAKEEAALAQLQLSTGPITSPSPIQEQAAAAKDRLAVMQARIAEQLSERADWSALLAVLSEKTPGSIRLDSIELVSPQGKGAPAARLSGIVSAGAGGGDSALAIRDYMNTLGALPITRAVNLGATQNTERDGMRVQRFELTLEMVGLPATALSGPASDKNVRLSEGANP